MNKFQIGDFLKRILNKKKKNKTLQVSRVGDISKVNINSGTIYIENRGGKERWLYLRCPCGCGDVITVNLMKSVYPHWETSTNGLGGLDISPSLRKITGCKSHFFVKNSQIIWF